VFDLDARYPPGIHGSRIGADAGNIPLPSGSVSHIVAFCAFNCLEGTTDIRFVREASRLLHAGGRLVIVPLCIADAHLNLYDPAICVSRESFDAGARRIAWHGWGNNFGRWYDRDAFTERVLSQFPRGQAQVYRAKNPLGDVAGDTVCYAATLTKSL
jgi:hypothetical protein